MKTLTLTAALLLTVLSTAFASGNEAITSQVKAVNIQNKKIKVLYTSSETNTVKVRITDSKGDLLHTDRIKKEGGFMQPYNVENLPAGTYYVAVTDASGTRTEAITLD